MAMRRRTFRRRTSFRRTRNAKKRYTWVTSFLPSCEPTNLPFVDCGDEDADPADNPFRIILFTNSGLQERFSDRVTVVRSVGRMWIRPFYNPTTVLPPDPTPAQVFAAVANEQSEWLMGLRKEQVTYDTTGPVQPITPSFLRDNLVLPDVQDFSEARWIRTWHRRQYQRFSSSQEVTIAGTPIGVCSDVHTTSGGIPPVNEFTDGNGTFEVETDCEIVGQPTTQATRQVTTIEATPDIVFSLSWRKRIPLRENEQLSLILNYWNPQLFGGGLDPTPAVSGVLHIDCKLLLEIG